MCYVNKATPIHFIDGKCHIKQLRAGKRLKSCKTCLTNHTWSISYHITLLVINVLGEDIDKHSRTSARTYTCTHNDARTKAISRNQACAGRRPTHALLKIDYKMKQRYFKIFEEFQGICSS